MKHRILIISHAHPSFSKGGGEIAAYNLHHAFSKHPDCESLFLGRHGHEVSSHFATPFSAMAKDDLLYLSYSDNFIFSNQNLASLSVQFKMLLLDYQPTVVHFHHYMHLGLEHLRIVRETLPTARIILTLHEYLAICNQQGQMVTIDSRLCFESSPTRCAHCLGRSSVDLFFRERFIKSHFAMVDRFISPSQFLIERYVAWGLAPEKISLLENGLPDTMLTSINEEVLVEDYQPLRFGYFGQINSFKGLDVLLEAVTLLPKALKKKIRLEIHGANLENQTPEFQAKIRRLLEKTLKTATYFGAYEPHEVISLMHGVDWIIVPSIWWENSPLVIQEAFAAKRPLIVSNIGGMAEKVKHELYGYHFRNRNAADLALVMERAVNDKRYQQLKKQLPVPITTTQSAQAHLNLYFSVSHEGCG